jgi:hypothetical protein
LENLESSQKCVIWKREKYESILNKVKTGKKELPQDYYYMQRYVQVIETGGATTPKSNPILII